MVGLTVGPCGGSFRVPRAIGLTAPRSVDLNLTSIILRLGQAWTNKKMVDGLYQLLIYIFIFREISHEAVGVKTIGFTGK